MSWFSRLFGSRPSKPTADPLDAIREAIRADGDDTDALERLLRQPCDLNALQGKPVFPIMLFGGAMLTNYGTLPLILAAMLYKPNRLRLLLTRGARPDVTCAHGRTPLHWAVLGEPDSRLLCSYGALCREAAAANQPPLPIGAIREEEQAASLAATKLLLEHRANPNAADNLGQTPLHRACMVGGKTEHLNLLLRWGAQVDAVTGTGVTPLIMAAQFGLEDAVTALLAAGADPNRADAFGSTPLHWACARAFLPVARRLLAAKADPNARDEQGFTPLGLAAQVGAPELVQALRAAGASETLAFAHTQVGPTPEPPQPSFPAISPLIVAAARGDLLMVRHLLQGPVDLEATTDDGWTALHEAVVHGPEMTRLLLEAGANPNASSEAGYTPLHRAAAKGQTDVVRLLVEYGADPSATDVCGATLLDFAQSSGNPETIAVVTELCKNAVQGSHEADRADRFFDYLLRSLDKAPERIARAKAVGLRLTSGGDGSSPECPVVVHGLDIGCGVTIMYQYLDEKFGPRRTNQDIAAGAPFERGWQLKRALSMRHGDQHLNCIEFVLPGGKEGKIYFDVTEWAGFDSTLAVMAAHARLAQSARSGPQQA